MKSSKCFHKYDTRGSAIIMALVTMTLLVCLGLALIVVSMGNLNISTADAANNDAYYAAEAGVNSALEQLKFEVSSYYKSMFDAQGSDYTSLYNNFFSGINANAINHYIKPAITGITAIDTTFTQGVYNSTDNTCNYSVSCISTAANGARYKVSGSLNIKRVDVKAGGGWSIPFRALTAGGTVNLGSSNQMEVHSGEADVAANIIRKETWMFDLKDGAYLTIDPNVGKTLHDTKKYTSYADPVITSPNMNISQNNAVISSFTATPIMVTSDPGINVTFSNCVVPNGTIYIKGNVTLTSANCNADIYCDGNFNASSLAIYGDVYCRGNVTISNVSMIGKIICDGTVSVTQGSLKGTVYAGNGISVSHASSTGSLFSPKAIYVSDAGISNGIIYSSTKITFGSANSTCVLFSGGDIVMNGWGDVHGAVAAIGNIYGITDSGSGMKIYYSQSVIDSVFADPDNTFFVSSPVPTLDSSVIQNQKVTAEGSVS